MTGTDRGRVTAGAILIVLGLAFLANQLIEGFGNEFWLLVLGGLFMGAYFYQRAYGFLVPGCILLGLSFGIFGQGTAISLGDFEAIGLGLGFVAIFVIDTLYRGRSHWWPLIPGGVLIVGGLAEGSQAIEEMLSFGWPVILILIGLIVLAGAFRDRDGKETIEDEEVSTVEEST